MMNAAIPRIKDTFRNLITWHVSRGEWEHAAMLLDLLLPHPANLPIDETLAVARVRAILERVGIPYEQALSLLVTYESHLRTYGLVVAAALLRKMNTPLFPDPFAWVSEGTSIGLRCEKCGSPINNPTNKLVCESCHVRSAGCGFCWMKESPYELARGGEREFARVTREQQPITSAWSGGTRLWSVCFDCGHCVHAACVKVRCSIVYIHFCRP